MASTANAFRNGQAPASRSRFGNIMSVNAGTTTNSSGIDANIWGLGPKDPYHSTAGDELRGSSSLEHSSVPDTSFARPSSSSAAAWTANGTSAAFNNMGTPGSGTSPLRQRTTQNTRSNSPFSAQAASGASASQVRLNPETRNFDPSNSYSDYFSSNVAGSRASSMHRNENAARSGHNDASVALNGYSSQAVSRTGSYPASRHGNEPSPTSMAFGVNMNEVNERLPRNTSHTQLFESLDRPQSQGHGRQMFFGELEAERRPSAPFLASALGGSFGGFDGAADMRSTRNGSFSSNAAQPSFDSIGMPQQADAYRGAGQSSSSTDLTGLENLSLSMQLHNGFPTLSHDGQRNGGSGSQSINPTHNLNQLRQNKSTHAQSYSQQRRPPFGQNAYSYQTPDQLLRNQLNVQAAQYAGYAANMQYWNPAQVIAAQRAAGQQHNYNHPEGQSRNYFGQPLGAQASRGPSRSSRSGRSDDSSTGTALTIKIQGNNWVQKQKQNGSTFIEASDDCRPKDIVGFVANFCGDQSGSRLVQTMIETANNEDKEAIFQEMLPNTIALCLDPFGNYVIQKFFEYGLLRQKEEMAAKMKGKIQQLSQHAYGCRCVQKAFEHILHAQRLELAEELKPCLHELAKDVQGNHVIQKVLQNMEAKDVQFILNGFDSVILPMSNDMYACRVVQRLLDYGDEYSKPRVTAEVVRHADILMRNPYGNYVVQHVIEFGTPQDRAAIDALIVPHVHELMVNKFASNVIEKCLTFGSEAHRDRLVAKICEVNPVTGEPKYLREAMTAAYANYVVQRTLKTLPSGKWEGFAGLVEAQMPWMLAERGRDKKYGEFEKLLKQGPFDRDGRVLPGSRAQSQVAGQSSTTDSGSQGTGTPPPLTRTQPSPQSSNAPSTSNSMVDGPTSSVHSGPGSNKSGGTVVGDTAADLAGAQKAAV